MSDHAKRTRSQLSLLDEFSDVPLGISPLKAARQERRKNMPVASPLVSDESRAPPNLGVNHSDDEFSLYHHKDPPQKRTSPKPQELSSENDTERQAKRLKTDHVEVDEPHRAHDAHPEESRVTEATQPSGPFDFSAINPTDLLSPKGSRQPGASWTKRAQSVPLTSSPSVPHRDLGQLMPSPRKTVSVSPVRETLRFSSLPHTLQPLIDDKVVRNFARSPTEPEHEKEPTASHTFSLPHALEPLTDDKVVRNFARSPTESEREKEPTASHTFSLPHALEPLTDDKVVRNFARSPTEPDREKEPTASHTFSLPHTLEPLTYDKIVRNFARSPTEPDREKEPTASHTLPASNEMDTPSREKPTPETDAIRPCDDQFPAAGPSLEVTASDVSLAGPLLPLDFCVTTPTTSPKGQDSDITPRATAPVPPSPPGCGLTSVPSSDPLSPLTEDPPSPLSALSSLSEPDYGPSPTDTEMCAFRQPPSRNSQEVTPRLSSCITTLKSNDALPLVTRPVTGATPIGKERRGIPMPYSSARLTRSSTTSDERETGSLHRNSAARIPSTPSVAPGPSSHKQPFSFAMPTSSSRNKTAERAPANSPQKLWLVPKRQPPKLSLSMEPASSLASGAPSHQPKHTGLSNLSLALEKLKAAPPSRPATTLGFNRNTDSAAHAIGTSNNIPKAKDDSTISLGNGLPSSSRMAPMPLKRAASVGPVASLQPNARAPGSATTTMTARPSILPPAAGPVAKISLNSGIVVGKNSFSKPRGFAYGGVGKRRPFEKVSKKSSLPVVEGSPVKASESSRAANGSCDELPLPSMGNLLPTASTSREEAVPVPLVGVEPMNLQEAFMGHVDVPTADGKADGDLAGDGEAELPDVWKNASRRASLASQFLQQTLAVLPSSPTPGSSKSTAVVRPQSSFQGTRSGLRSGNSLDVAGSRSVPRAPSNGPDARAHVSRPGTTAGASSVTKQSSLKVLKSCTIFVDVRTDDGDDAGGLFVDMLRGLGAKIIGRAGQSCTHIVYKNGLMSTLTKYRLMRDPKPHVVGISWVVECTEQRRRVEEGNFAVDLEGLNIAGNNKRRRSMLPKHISSNMQSHVVAAPPRPTSSLGGTLMSDQSLDGSSVGADHSLHSSDGVAEDEDDLAPLERARQRRNIFFKR